jgi:hypothetical protein
MQARWSPKMKNQHTRSVDTGLNGGAWNSFSIPLILCSPAPIASGTNYVCLTWWWHEHQANNKLAVSPFLPLSIPVEWMSPKIGHTIQEITTNHCVTRSMHEIPIVATLSLLFQKVQLANLQPFRNSPFKFCTICNWCVRMRKGPR